MYEIGGKIALVTGGASGIGLSIGRALLDNGLKGLVLADINDVGGEKVLHEIKDQYGEDKAIFLKLDVSDRNQFEDAFKRTVENFHNLDIVVNSAGILAEKEWEKEIATNLTGTTTGTVLAIEEFLPKHRTDQEAVVVNVSSILGIRHYNSAPIYTATKRGIIGLIKSIGSEFHYRRTKVRVMALCPGLTDTPFKSQKDCSFLSEVYRDVGMSEFGTAHVQDVKSVSNAVLQIIRAGNSGSVWVVENDQAPYEFKPQNQ